MWTGTSRGPTFALHSSTGKEPRPHCATRSQALLPAVSQADSMVAIVGTDPKEYVVDVGFFAPASPFASDAGLAPLKGPRDLERAKRLLREAGYSPTTTRC